LLIKTDRDHIIIEEKVDENLYELLLSLENKNNPTPYLEESQARSLIRSLREGLENYESHGLIYNAINPKNIVRRGLEWKLSLTGLLVKNEK
jgi:serine/threonine protein kinase